MLPWNFFLPDHAGFFTADTATPFGDQDSSLGPSSVRLLSLLGPSVHFPVNLVSSPAKSV